jgi:DNA-binding winged helix-turn-helix (wHTH) protein/tetratricopeptide (TPR) repeat protein
LGNFQEFPQNGAPRFLFGEFQLEVAQQRLYKGGTVIPLRNRPFEVLLYLVRRPGVLVTQAELLASIWGADDVYHDALRKAVGSIRGALGDDSQQPRFVETQWGKGYRFIAPVTELATAEISADTIARDISSEADRQPLAETTGHFVDRRPIQWPFSIWPRLFIPALCVALALALVLVGSATIDQRASPTPHLTQHKATAHAHALSSPTKSQPEAEKAAYLDAKYLLSQRSAVSIPRAIEGFKRIIKADPRAGDAYAGLSECYALGYWGFWNIDAANSLAQAALYARKAVQVDSSSVYAHVQLAASLLRDLKIAEAQAEFEQALALGPEDAEAHHAYAVFLDDTGRAEAGILEMKRAIELQQLSLAYKTDLGMSYYFARRYDEAIAVYRSVLDLDPNFTEARDYLASALVMKGRWTEAQAEFDQLDRATSAKGGDLQSTGQRVVTLQRIGRRRAAQIATVRLEAAHTPEHAYYLADIYAQSGRQQEALKYVRQLVDSSNIVKFLLLSDPLLNPLEGNPEFQSMMIRLKTTFVVAAKTRSADYGTYRVAPPVRTLAPVS